MKLLAATEDKNLGNLIQNIVLKSDYTGTAVADVVGMFLAEITDTLEAGGTVSIRDFGILTPRLLAKRNGRNPKTGETVVIPARTQIAFRRAGWMKNLPVKVAKKA